MFVGTCGVFGKFGSPKLVTTDLIYWMPTCERMGFSETPSDLYPVISSPVCASLNALTKVTTLTSAAISSSDKIHLRFSDFIKSEKLLVENLELYPFVKEVLPHVKSLGIVFAVTNRVGATGRAQWLQHYKEASILSASFIKENFYWG